MQLVPSCHICFANATTVKLGCTSTAIEVKRSKAKEHHLRGSNYSQENYVY